MEATVVTLYRFTEPEDNHRTYAVLEPGAAGIIKIELSVCIEDVSAWAEIEPAIVATIGGILGPTYADKVVLDRSSRH
jgi:hypothetical protein